MTTRIEKHIWGLFAGRCAMCRKSLIHDNPDSGRSLIGEIAHIVGHRKGSARYDHPLDSSERNKPDNLILLCRDEHKIIDDNEDSYPVEKLQKLRNDYLIWLESQLEKASPWKLIVSSFVFLNVPRLHEYAEINGYKIQHSGPQSGQTLNELEYELNYLMRSYKATLENMAIDSILAEHIKFAHEGYVGALVCFDRLRFRTKNILPSNNQTNESFPFTGDPKSDPHITHKFDAWELVLNIDPRWITTSTAFTVFRPSGGHTLFSGFARLTHVDLETGRVTATALALGNPKPSYQVSEDNNTSTVAVDFSALEDNATKSRKQYGSSNIEACNLCGKIFENGDYMVDGPAYPNAPWGFLCEACYSKNAAPLGVGKGQLFHRIDTRWKLVGGYPIPI